MSYKSSSLIVLVVLTLLLRGLGAGWQHHPSYMDEAYYYVNAVNLVEERGFVEDFIWNYLNAPGAPPQPSHLYWMPLTSIIAVPGLWVSQSYDGAQLPFILLSSLLPLLTYGLCWQVTRKHGLSLLAGGLMVFSGFYVPYWTAVDNFTPFALFGAIALYAASRALSPPKSPQRGNLTTPFPLGGAGGGLSLWLRGKKLWQWAILSGIAVGLAHLSRADGPLLFVAIGAWYVMRIGWVERRETQQIEPHFGFRFALPNLRFVLPLILILLAYLLTTVPWLARNWSVTGKFLPAGSQTIWLTEYDELFSYGRELSAQTFLAQGWSAIFESRWLAITVNLQRMLAEWFLIVLLPLVIVGGWQLRRIGLMQLVAGYAVLLFVAMSVVFAFPGLRGGLFHSAGALLPFIYTVAVVGLQASIAWLANRRKAWRADLAVPIFGAALLLVALGISGLAYQQRVLDQNRWNDGPTRYEPVVAWLAENAPTATVMIGNPPRYRYHGGGLSIIVPNEPLTTTLTVMEHYDAQYLVLDHNYTAPLRPLYQTPNLSPQLILRATFGTVQPIYLFERND